MSLDDLKTANFLHIEPDSVFYRFFLESTYPWELLGKIGDFVKAIGASLSLSDYEKSAMTFDFGHYLAATTSKVYVIESGVAGEYLSRQGLHRSAICCGYHRDQNSFLIGLWRCCITITSR